MSMFNILSVFMGVCFMFKYVYVCVVQVCVCLVQFFPVCGAGVFFVSSKCVYGPSACVYGPRVCLYDPSVYVA